MALIKITQINLNLQGHRLECENVLATNSIQSPLISKLAIYTIKIWNLTETIKIPPD